MNLQIQNINNCTFSQTQTINNNLIRSYQPKFNTTLLKDTVSFGSSSQNEPEEILKIKAKDIKTLKSKNIEEIEEFFQQTNRLGENIFWQMTPKAIIKSAELLNKKGLDNLLVESITSFDTNGQNILSIISTDKKLDSITQALSNKPEVLTELLSYPNPQSVTETILKNSLHSETDENNMIKSLNRAWHVAAKVSTPKAYELLQSNEQYLNKANKDLLSELKHSF